MKHFHSSSIHQEAKAIKISSLSPQGIACDHRRHQFVTRPSRCSLHCKHIWKFHTALASYVMAHYLNYSLFDKETQTIKPSSWSTGHTYSVE